MTNRWQTQKTGGWQSKWHSPRESMLAQSSLTHGSRSNSASCLLTAFYFTRWTDTWKDCVCVDISVTKLFIYLIILLKSCPGTVFQDPACLGSPSRLPVCCAAHKGTVSHCEPSALGHSPAALASPSGLADCQCSELIHSTGCHIAEYTLVHWINLTLHFLAGGCQI